MEGEEERRKGKGKNEEFEGIKGDWKRRRKAFSTIFFFHHCGYREAD